MDAIKRYPAVLLCLIAFVIFTGCVTESMDANRFARYRPVADRSPWQWRSPTQSDPSGTDEQSPGDLDPSARYLKKGDKLSISIRDIPTPQDIKDIKVDGSGCINLPLIGPTRVEGKTTSDVESLIQNAYVDGGYYKRITVIVVAEEDRYYSITGEVKKEGKYMVSPGLTLLQAIAEGGGYTDYAKTAEVKIIRGADVTSLDTRQIEEGKEKDPVIMPGDIILVPRRRI